MAMRYPFRFGVRCRLGWHKWTTIFTVRPWCWRCGVDL